MNVEDKRVYDGADEVERVRVESSWCLVERRRGERNSRLEDFQKAQSLSLRSPKIFRFP